MPRKRAHTSLPKGGKGIQLGKQIIQVNMRGGAHISRSKDKGIQSSQEKEDPVVIIIEKEIQGLPPSSDRCSIYKIPDSLRKMSIESYTPRVVTIGPFHFKPGLKMNEHKFRYMKSFLKRYEIGLANFVETIRTWEENFRNCYAEIIELDSNELAGMMVMDGCFVVELMLRCRFKDLIEEGDRIFDKPRMIDDVLHDLILLENQLPFFVLDSIFKQVPTRFLSKYPGLSIIDLIHCLIRPLVKNECPLDPSREHGINHIVDFARRYYLPKSQTEHQGLKVADNPLNEIPPSATEVQIPPSATELGEIQIPPSATELDEAGVKFTCKTTTTTAVNLFSLGVKFKNGVLEIPKFEIDDWTETMFRNLMAFEQCHDIEDHVTQYAFLMDCFINTAKDVDLLKKSGVISCALGSSEDVVKLFNHLCKEVTLGEKSLYSEVYKGLNAYCKTRRHRWRASLTRDYFKNPWIIASTIAAVVVIVLTLIQTVCSILQVK